MSTPITDPFALTMTDLRRLLDTDAPFLPELDAARADPALLRQAPRALVVLGQTEPLMADIAQIPRTAYTHYRQYVRTGDRRSYEGPSFLKRTRLSGAALP